MNGEAVVRLSLFLGVFSVLAISEVLWPFRPTAVRAERWPANLGLSVLNTIVVRVLIGLVPGFAIAAAAAVGKETGLLAFTGLHGAAVAVTGFVVLDLAVYLQHIAFHHIPVFWRLHRVHHADRQFDVTTAIRFHPLEIVISQLWKIAVVVVLGVPVVSVFAFEVVLNAGAMFSHSNLRLPGWIDRQLRVLLVTPDMHRIHHSVLLPEINSNYGFNFSFWDRAFGTYRDRSQSDQLTMDLGLPGYQTSPTSRIGWLLVFPFLRGRSL
ncbi:MAG: sterol desaturase family protein [Micropepsaceae bacterium]